MLIEQNYIDEMEDITVLSNKKFCNDGNVLHLLYPVW